MSEQPADQCGCLLATADPDELAPPSWDRGGCNWQTCECACHYPPGASDKTTDTLEGHPCCVGHCRDPAAVAILSAATDRANRNGAVPK